MLDFLVLPPAAEVRPAASPLHAFTANAPAGVWRAGDLPVTFAIALPRSRDLGDDEDAELDVALRAWTAAPCTALRARVGATTSAPAADDGVNGVYFHDVAWPAELPAGVVATTVVHVDGAGFYRDADIHLNGAQYTFSFDGRPGTIDLGSVLTHELGHALGLGHSLDARATMYASYPGGGAWRSLEPDDKAGVCSLYPGAGLTQGCDALPCPASHVCVATTCERRGAIAAVCSPCERVAGACAAAGDDARCIDLPLGGLVCGRACAQDADCGARFHCVSTTTAGDMQCVSDDACALGPDACEKDAECTFGRCRNGACVGESALADAGAPPADAATVPPAAGSSGGCSAQGGSPAGGVGLAAIVLSLALRRRR